MYRIALAELAACALLWLVPFFWRLAFGPKREPAVTVRAAEWGMLLQAISYGLLWLDRLPPGAASPLRLTASMLCGPIAVALTWTAVPRLGKQWRIRAGLYSDHELVRTGPYALVRHPIYASMLAIFLAVGFLVSTWVSFSVALVFFTAGTEIRVRVEDRLLASRFGDGFQRYKRHVKAYVPFLR